MAFCLHAYLVSIQPNGLEEAVHHIRVRQRELLQIPVFAVDGECGEEKAPELLNSSGRRIV